MRQAGGGQDATRTSWRISGPGRGPTIGGPSLGPGGGGQPQGKDVPPGAFKVRWNPALYGVIPRAILYIVQRTQVSTPFVTSMLNCGAWIFLFLLWYLILWRAQALSTASADARNATPGVEPNPIGLSLPTITFRMQASFIEIYNEQVQSQFAFWINNKQQIKYCRTDYRLYSKFSYANIMQTVSSPMQKYGNANICCVHYESPFFTLKNREWSVKIFLFVQNT